MTFRRMWNAILLKGGLVYSGIRKRPYIWAMPFAVSAETVRGCNMNCSHCPAAALKGDQIRFMPADVFYNLINRIYRKTFYLQLWFQGEPLLHPQIGSLVAYAKKRNMFTVLATNAMLLSEERCGELIAAGLSHLIVSIDMSGSDADFFVGGHYKEAVENIRTLSDMKKRKKIRYPLIEAQMVVTAFNETEMIRFKQEMKNAGADKIKYKSAWFAELGKDDLPVPSRHARYKRKTAGGWEPVRPVRNRCRRIFSTMVVGYNGDVLPCCFDKQCRFMVGNVQNETPLRIWRGTRFMDFRRSVLKNRKSNAMCVNCTE